MAASVPGSEYKMKKAKGDMKKKGKPDPYAYVPLARSTLNKRYFSRVLIHVAYSLQRYFYLI